jgi:hypothetical protein
MKKELSKIAQDLEQGAITDNEAQTLLLGLLGVMPSKFNRIRTAKLKDLEMWETDCEFMKKNNINKETLITINECFRDDKKCEVYYELHYWA